MMQLSIDEEQLDELIRQRLADDYETLKEEFLKPGYIPMYSHDKEINMELMFSLIQAIRTVHNYYAAPSKKILY